MYQLRCFEAMESVGSTKDGALFFADWGVFGFVLPSDVKPVLTYFGDDLYYIDGDHVWIRRGYDLGTSEQTDEYQVDIYSLHDLSTVKATTYLRGRLKSIISNKLVTMMYGEDETSLLIYSESCKEKHRLSFTETQDVEVLSNVINSIVLFISDRSVKPNRRSISVLSLDGIEKLQIEYPEEYVSKYDSLKRYPSIPVCVNELIVLNLGTNQQTDAGKIIACSLHDGSLVWEYETQKQPTTFFVINERVYMVVQESLVVLDANTGDQLVNQLFKKNISESQEVLFCPYKNQLVLVLNRFNTENQFMSTVDIISSDGSTIVQTIEVPYPNYINLTSHLSHIDTHNLFLYYSNGFGIDGAVRLVEVDKQEGDFEVLPRIPMETIREVNNRESVYVVKTEHDNLEELVLYGRLYLRESMYYPSELSDNRDKMHRGKVVFQVDLSKLPENAMEKINSMLLFEEDDLGSLMNPGAGSRYEFSLSLRDSST